MLIRRPPCPASLPGACQGPRRARGSSANRRGSSRRACLGAPSRADGESGLRHPSRLVRFPSWQQATRGRCPAASNY
jgi:hypothetical protein